MPQKGDKMTLQGCEKTHHQKNELEKRGIRMAKKGL